MLRKEYIAVHFIVLTILLNLKFQLIEKLYLPLNLKEPKNITILHNTWVGHGIGTQFCDIPMYLGNLKNYYKFKRKANYFKTNI